MQAGAKSPGAGSFESGSMAESTEYRSEEYRCNCGLNAVIRTSFTFQDMGKRFRCCPKEKDPCNYFHFIAGEEKIEGRAMELLLVLKDKECKVVKEKEKIMQEKDELMLENGRLMEENGKLLTENGKLLQENVQLKECNGLMDRNVQVLEKKVKVVEKRYSKVVMISEVICLVFLTFIGLISSVFLLRITKY